MTRSQSARSTPAGVVDEDAQRFVAGLLDGDEVERRVELGKLLLWMSFLKVCS